MEEIKKYMSDETLNEVVEKFETALGTVFLAIFPVIISGAALLLLSIFEGIKNSSLVFGLLFFICLIPLFILGIGAFSIGNALYRLIDSINFLFLTTVNISVAVYRDNKALSNGSVSAVNVCNYSFNNILLPILKTVVKRKFIGNIMLKLIESIFKRGIKPISNIIENKVEEENNNQNGVSGFQESDSRLPMKGLDKINNITKMTIRSVRIFSIIISVIFALAGILLTAILFAVHTVFKF